MWRSWKLLLSGALLAACASSEPAPSPDVRAAAATPPIQYCEAVTSLEVVHRVAGVAVTDRVRLVPGAAADPEQALRAFQRAADHFGTATIVSTRPVREIACFATPPSDDAEAAAPARHLRGRLAATADFDGGAVCASEDEVFACDELAADRRYGYATVDDCSVTAIGSEAAEYACDGSGAIVTRNGDVVLTVNTDAIREQVLDRTAALRRIVGDANVLTNFHFNVVISPDSEAALIPNAAFDGIKRQVVQASQLGQPLPDIDGLLAALPQRPTNVAFRAKLQDAYRHYGEELELLAAIVNGSHLSPDQVTAFKRLFVSKSTLIDRLRAEQTAASLHQAANLIEDTISQLASADPGSTIYEETKAGARAVLETQTTCGLFDPAHVLDTVPPLYQHLTDADLEKRIASQELLIKLNEILRKTNLDHVLPAVGPLFHLAARELEDGEVDNVWRIYDQVEKAEFFAEGKDPRGTRYDVRLNDRARAMFDVEVSPTSAATYDVITVLNETADYHAQTGQVTVEYQAIIMLHARAALDTSDAIRALYHTDESFGVLGFLKHFSWGALVGTYDMASGLGQVIRHPIDTFDALKAAIVNWPQTLELVWNQGAQLIHDWPNMTPAQKAEFMGNMAAQILAELPAAARSANRVDEAIRAAAKLHLDEASLGLQIAERAGLELGPKLASELARRMEQLGVTSVDDMAELAHKLDELLPCRLTGLGFAPDLASAIEPPCPVEAISRLIEGFRTEARRMGMASEQEIADLAEAQARLGMHVVGPTTWETASGLKYGRNNTETRVQHVLKHLVNDTSKTTHGVFTVARREVLPTIEEGWQKVLNEHVQGVPSPSNPNNRLYHVYMGPTPIGYVGGSSGGNQRRPAKYLDIVVRDGTTEVITAFPAERRAGDPEDLRARGLAFN